MNKEALLNLIPTGEENAIPAEKLAGVLHRDKRVLRAMVSQLRRDGAVIGSNERGYFIPATIEELERTLKRNTRRAKSCLRDWKPARELLRRWKEKELQTDFLGT